MPTLFLSLELMRMAAPWMWASLDSAFVTGLFIIIVGGGILVLDVWGLHGGRSNHSDHGDINDWDGTE